MRLSEIVAALDLKVVAGDPDRVGEVSRGYVGDLLSDVLGNARTGDLWVTMQIHRNIIAVGTARELSGIILVADRRPGAEVIAEAERERVPLMISSLTAFELVGRLYELGLGGMGSSRENF